MTKGTSMYWCVSQWVCETEKNDKNSRKRGIEGDEKGTHKEFGLVWVHGNPWATCLYIPYMSLIKLKVLSAPLSTITDFSIITIGWMGAARRDSDGEGRVRECRYVLWVSNDREGRRKCGRAGRGEKCVRGAQTERETRGEVWEQRVWLQRSLWLLTQNTELIRWPLLHG